MRSTIKLGDRQKSGAPCRDRTDISCLEGKGITTMLMVRKWSGQRELNPHVRLGKATGGLYIMPALKAWSLPLSHHSARRARCRCIVFFNEGWFEASVPSHSIKVSYSLTAPNVNKYTTTSKRCQLFYRLKR